MSTEIFKEILKSNQIFATNWIVITGAPSSGKTTLINEISKLGHKVLNDVAREIILEMRLNSIEFSEKEKQLLIVDRLLQKYSNISKKDVIFLDYGMPDNIVFQNLAGFSIKITEAAAKIIRYKKVFVLSPLQIEYDDVRDLDYETQDKIHKEIVKIYKNFGYNPVLISSGTIQARLDKIFYCLTNNC